MRGTHHLRPALLFCALLLQCVCAVGADKQALYFIDAHSQVDQTIDLDTVISLMNQAGVQTTILSAVAARSSRDIVIFARQHPDRIIPAVRMKRRAFNDNDAEYFRGSQGRSRQWPIQSHVGSDDVLAPEWRELAIRYPDRFVLSFDNVRPEMWGAFYLAEARVWRRALSELPDPVAQAIAHGNAERLWKIPPR
jgi:hypothetical protein